ncbi:hypothetical protein A7985_10665 [Pseudoalteromonas luteoviolacea]|uniref:DUF5329 domain-containing protein n=1 Tax=Pseudoalteromonas luteoviolacea TaxID=43657 RepID=A0A1C0TSM8_9GAMM|nr:DUF5329 family protein [Pseudoalteromonas luteoviolacea]MBQ4810903.1 DUF5329 family protein [Pseudoalteromonas luteoviolacea]OCQ22237.1 hypothetical protein A7985_10665 [Pseudoalteromonas luteoviolacea]
MKANKLAIITTLLISASVAAEIPSEITHLLEYVEQSGCEYERNGRFHSAADARAHIMKKYEYYQDDIDSTEDFIHYAASKSALSGKYYKIHCSGKEAIRSQDWLILELNRLRREQRAFNK